MDYLNDWCLCMHVYVWTFNISDPIQWQIFLIKTKHSIPCCNTVQLLCMIPMGHREWYCARLVLAAGLNATQHGSALFLISWSLHNQRHSGQLRISLETRGSLCSNNNDDNRFWNPPPKLQWLHCGIFMATARRRPQIHSPQIQIFSIWEFLSGPSKSEAVYFQYRLRLARPCKNRSQKPPSTQRALPSCGLQSSLQVQSLHLNNIHHSYFQAPLPTTEMLLCFSRTIIALYWASTQLA